MAKTSMVNREVKRAKLAKALLEAFRFPFRN